MLNRKGTFTLDYQLIRENPILAKDILSTVVVVRAENCFVEDTVTYWAYSEHFDEVQPPLRAPKYEAIVSVRGILKEWRKVE